MDVTRFIKYELFAPIRKFSLISRYLNNSFMIAHASNDALFINCAKIDDISPFRWFQRNDDMAVIILQLAMKHGSLKILHYMKNKFSTYYITNDNPFNFDEIIIHCLRMATCDYLHVLLWTCGNVDGSFDFWNNFGNNNDTEIYVYHLSKKSCIKIKMNCDACSIAINGCHKKCSQRNIIQ
jgi:hypothetical protein